MPDEPHSSELNETLLEHLRGVSVALDQLAGQDPQAFSAAVRQLRSLAEGMGDGSCGGRFLMMASTYLNYSAWVRSPFGASMDSGTSG